MDDLDSYDREAQAFVEDLFAEHLVLPPILPVNEWADRHRILLSGSSSEPGPWRTERTPYMRQILEDLSDGSPHEEIVLMFGTQLSKSESGNNWIGSIIDQTPASVLLIEPTVDLAKRYSKQRIAPMIRSCAVLSGKVRDARSRDSGNTTLLKEFPGGVLVITGANSAAGLASMPIRYLFADEIDDYPLDVDGQGEPLSIAMKRQDTFASRKRLVTSSPKRGKGHSLIEARYDMGTGCRYHVPCPECGHFQELQWAEEEGDPGLRAVGTDPDSATAVYICCGCGCEIAEHHKTAMLARGVWVAARPGAAIRSYHLSSLYSPVGWLAWRQIVKEYLEAVQASARGDPALLKTWRNTRLAQTFREEGSRLDSDVLAERKGQRPLGMVPMPCLVLTGSVDVQPNRLELNVWGWGPGLECAIVDTHQIWGDTAQTERLPGGLPTVWERLDVLQTHRYRHESGATLAIDAVAVDTGYNAHEVYAYCRVRRVVRCQANGLTWHRRTFAVKGQDKPGGPVKGKASPQDVNLAGRIIKGGVLLWMVGTNTAKDWWHAHLRMRDAGPGFVHLANDLPDDWFEQMASEERVRAKTARGERWVWQKITGRRNEAWDCAVYALFAAHCLDLHRYTAEMWQRLRSRIAPAEPDLLSPVSEAVAAEPSRPASETRPALHVDVAEPAAQARPPAMIDDARAAPAPSPPPSSGRRFRVL